tara:strand:- start:10 stop:138 length:129 start_codon:yes stop_codon:yes gene_type:complete
VPTKINIMDKLTKIEAFIKKMVVAKKIRIKKSQQEYLKQLSL